MAVKNSLFCADPALSWDLELLQHGFGTLSWVICQKAVSFSEITRADTHIQSQLKDAPF